jgi:hypothetical protein
VILTICSDKGSPGVTTAATALSVMWPSERVLLEADPSGGDLSLRLRTPQGENLPLDRSVTSVAADAREGLPPGALARYAQQTSLGFPVLLGPMSAEGFEAMSRLWPQVAAAAHAWPGTVIADLGRLQLRHASSPVAAASTTVLLLTRASTSEDLFHVRQRAHELAARLGQGPHGRSPLVVAVVAPSRGAHGQVGQVQQALAAQPTTSTIPVAGFVAYEEKAVVALRDGVVTKRLLGSDLLKSAKELAETLTGWFPELAGMPTPPVVPATEAGRHHPASGDGHAWRQPMTPVEQYQAQTAWRTVTEPNPGGGPQ